MTEIIIENNESLQSIPNDCFGVYAIVFCTDHGRKIYIGSTAESFHGRLRRHFGLLKKGNHPNPYMQSLWNKHKVFRFEILKILNSQDLVVVEEQKYIDQLCEVERINFGPALPSPTFGMKYSLETRKKISRAMKERLKSPEERKKISRAGSVHSQETREKMSRSHKGMSGRKLSFESRVKISAARKGKKLGPRSLETRKKISQSNLGRVMSPKAREALLKSHIGKSLSPETRKRISDGGKLKWQDPEHSTKMSAIRKASWAKKKAGMAND